PGVGADPVGDPPINPQEEAKRQMIESLGDDLVTSESESQNGKWYKGSYDSVEESINEHFRRHGNEVRAKDADDYARKAESFYETNRRRIKWSKGQEIPGHTPDVKRFRFGRNRYIDLHRDSDGEYRIISYGARER
ncbi:hypothetical protein IH992_28090, partial [Candidatus Poribacteria bacterium]|nr:hypothetical protein [Candidatus Poribacteria bacterium]